MTNGVNSSSQGIVLIFKSSSFTVCPNVVSLLCCNSSHIQFHDSQLSFLGVTIVTGPLGVRGDSNVEGPSNKQAGWSLGGVFDSQHFPYTCTMHSFKFNFHVCAYMHSYMCSFMCTKCIQEPVEIKSFHARDWVSGRVLWALDCWAIYAAQPFSKNCPAH